MDCRSDRAGIPSPDFAIGKFKRIVRAWEGTSKVESTTALTKLSKSRKSDASIASDLRRWMILEAMQKRARRRKDCSRKCLAANKRRRAEEAA
jgi:hypothetical protein